MHNSPAFGYLDFLEDPTLGTTGGYLIVSATGRPLEFHCTAPVLASRAQQILYGPTLRPHLLGELVGAALVDRASIAPQVVAISDADLAAATSGRGLPVALVPREEMGAAPPGGWSRVPKSDAAAWAQLGDVDRVASALAQLAASVELAEPFERIREAIREAQRLGQDEAPQRDAA